MVETSGTGECLLHYFCFHVETNKLNKIVTDIMRFSCVG